MYSVLDIWHSASIFDEILDDFIITVLAGFEALAIVKDELLVVAGDNFGIDVRYACIDVRYVLSTTVSGKISGMQKYHQ
jgi:hypothetical protein